MHGGGRHVAWGLLLLIGAACAYDCHQALPVLTEVSTSGTLLLGTTQAVELSGSTTMALYESDSNASTMKIISSVVSGDCALYVNFNSMPSIPNNQINANGTTNMYVHDISSDDATWSFVVTTDSSCSMTIVATGSKCRSIDQDIDGSVEVDVSAHETFDLCLKQASRDGAHTMKMDVSSVTGNCLMYGDIDNMPGSSAQLFNFSESSGSGHTFLSHNVEIGGGTDWFYRIRPMTEGHSCTFTLSPKEDFPQEVLTVGDDDNNVYYQGFAVAPTLTTSSVDSIFYITEKWGCTLNVAFGGDGCRYTVRSGAMTPEFGDEEYTVSNNYHPDSMVFTSHIATDACSSETIWVIAVHNMAACLSPHFVVQSYNGTFQEVSGKDAEDADVTLVGVSRRGAEIIPFELKHGDEEFATGYIEWVSFTEGCSVHLTYGYFDTADSSTSAVVIATTAGITSLVAEGRPDGEKKWKGVMSVPAGGACELVFTGAGSLAIDGIDDESGTISVENVVNGTAVYAKVAPLEGRGVIAVTFDADTSSTCRLYPSPGSVSLLGSYVSPGDGETSFVAYNSTHTVEWYLTIQAVGGDCVEPRVSVRPAEHVIRTGSKEDEIDIDQDANVYGLVVLSLPLEEGLGSGIILQKSATCVSAVRMGGIGLASGQTSSYVSTGSDAQAMNGKSVLYTVLDSDSPQVFLLVYPGSGGCSFQYIFTPAETEISSAIHENDAGRFKLVSTTTSTAAAYVSISGKVGADCRSVTMTKGSTMMQGTEVAGYTTDTTTNTVAMLNSVASSGSTLTEWVQILDLCPSGTCGDCSVGTASATGAFPGGFCGSCPAGSYQPSTGDIASCKPCAAGSHQPSIAQGSCTLCAVGTFVNHTGHAETECDECPIGHYASTTGQGACTKCNAGYYQDEIKQTSCKRCDEGTFMSGTGGAQCQSCPAGTSSSTARTQCNTCAKGSYALEKAPACTQCPHGSTTQENGASSETFCACDTSQYGDKDNSLTCKGCPANTVCGWNTKFPVAQAGYWIASSDGDVSYKCTPASACPGGIDSCNEGYTGQACSECADNYYRANGVCYKCSAGAIDNAVIITLFVLAGLGIPCALCLFFVMAGFVYDMVSIRAAASAAAGFKTNLKLSSIFVPITRTLVPTGKIVKFMQLTTISLGLNISWPASISWMYDLVSVSTFNFDFILQPECRSGSLFSYQAKYYLRASIPLLIILSCLMVMCCGRCVSIGTSALKPVVYTFRHNHRRWNALGKNIITVGVRALLIFLILIYVFAHSVALEIFSCSERSEGEYYLLQDAKVQCYKGAGEWIEMLPVSIMCLIIYSLGIPMVFGIIIIRYRKTKGPAGPIGQARYGFIFGAYETKFYYWEMIIFLNKFLLTCVMPIITLGTRDQLNYLTFMALMFLLILVRFMPYDNPKEDVMEFNVAFAILFTTLSGLVFQSDNGSSVTSKFFEIVLVIVHTYVWLYFFYFLADVLNISKVVKRFCPTRGSVTQIDEKEQPPPISYALMDEDYDSAVAQMKDSARQYEYLAHADGVLPKIVKNMTSNTPAAKRASEIPIFESAGQDGMVPPTPTVIDKISAEDARRHYNATQLLEIFNGLERDVKFLVAVGENIKKRYSSINLDSSLGGADDSGGPFAVRGDSDFDVGSSTADHREPSAPVSFIDASPAMRPRKVKTMSALSDTPLLSTRQVTSSGMSASPAASPSKHDVGNAFTDDNTDSSGGKPELASQDQDDLHLLGDNTKLRKTSSSMDVRKAVTSGVSHMRNLSAASGDLLDQVLDNVPKLRRGSGSSRQGSLTNLHMSATGSPLSTPRGAGSKQGSGSNLHASATASPLGTPR